MPMPNNNKTRPTTDELITKALNTKLSDTESHYAMTALASAMNDIAKALNGISIRLANPPMVVHKTYDD